MKNNLRVIIIIFSIYPTFLFCQPGDPMFKPSKEFRAYNKYELEGYASYIPGNKWGFEKTHNGTDYFHISEAIYDKIWFSQQVGGIWIIEKDSLYGFASINGEIIIEPLYNNYQIRPERTCEPLHIYVQNNDKWGVLGFEGKSSGKMLIEPKYGTKPIYRRTFVLGQISDNWKTNDWGISDTSGAILFPHSFSLNEISFCNPSDICSNLFGTDMSILLKNSENKTAWYSIQGKKYSDYKYQSICCKNGKYAIAQKEQLKVGIVDSFGIEIVPCEYEAIWYVNDTSYSKELFAYGIKDLENHYFDSLGNTLRIEQLSKLIAGFWLSNTRDRREDNDHYVKTKWTTRIFDNKGKLLGKSRIKENKKGKFQISKTKTFFFFWRREKNVAKKV